MKAAEVLAGTSAELSVDLELGGSKTARVLLRALSDVEDAAAIAYGIRFAKERGAPDATHGHPLFDKGLRAYTVFLATLDPESMPEAREHFFATPEQVVEKFHPDWVLYLYHRWQVWQDQCSPLIRTMSTVDLLNACEELAKDGDDFAFFCKLSPITRAILARFSASRALSSPELRSLRTSLLEGTPPTA